MKILIAVASRHGSTLGVAEAIGKVLRADGAEVDIVTTDEVDDLGSYDAVVLGSAVYLGKWLKPARKFAHVHREEFAEIPTWIFSVGALGDPPMPEDCPQVDAIVVETGARDHRLFGGKLDRDDLSLSERLIVHTVHPPEGDYRDWSAVERWARSISATLSPVIGRDGLRRGRVGPPSSPV